MSKNAMTMVPFNDIHKNSYNLRDEFTACKGHFDRETKVWMVPQGALAHLKELSENLNKKSKDTSMEIWKKACSSLGFRFVKKGTPEYEKVLIKFKEMMKNPPKADEPNENDEDYDEDDVVFD